MSDRGLKRVGAASARQDRAKRLTTTSCRSSSSTLSFRERILRAEFHDVLLFRQAMINLGLLKIQLQCLTCALDQANQQVKHILAIIMEKPDIFDNPDKYKEWYPYQQWKVHLAQREKIAEKIHALHVEVKEARRNRLTDFDDEDATASTLTWQ